MSSHQARVRRQQVNESDEIADQDHNCAAPLAGCHPLPSFARTVADPESCPLAPSKSSVTCVSGSIRRSSTIELLIAYWISSAPVLMLSCSIIVYLWNATVRGVTFSTAATSF